ncbi:MAG: extracellular solute-binding protein [Chloroflexi bacterium]|nr:extracellular solute-binding protein [Chloroflexota bacterium]
MSTAAFLAACAAPGAAPAPAASEGGQAAAPTAEKVKIEYQSREPENAAGVQQLWNEWYSTFQAAHPDIEIEFLPTPGGNEIEVAMTAMVAGTATDIYEFCCQNSTYFIQQGQSLNLQPYIDKDAAEVNIDDYYKHQFDPWKKDGDIQMMPRFTGTQLVYYNKDWFDKAGVPYPGKEWGSWNYQEYAEIGSKFVNADPQTWATSNYGNGANWLTQYWLRGWGTHMVNPDDSTECLLASQEAQECLEYLRALTWDSKEYVYGGSAMSGNIGPDVLFTSERIAMVEIGPWALNQVLDSAQFKWDVAPMPNGPAGPTTHQSVDGSLVWVNSEHPDEAWTVLKGTTSPEFGRLYAKHANKQPSRKSILAEFPKLLRDLDVRYNDINLEIFIDSLAKDIGGPEEMFAKDVATKSQILQPAFDQVMLQGTQGVEYIGKFADVATRYNRGEIPDEKLGEELQKVQ